MQELLVHRTYLLQKFPGKGGWTYIIIPEITPDERAPFGWVKVQGTIDGYAIKQYRLMPLGNGSMFLPVKAAIRKSIGKKAGDYAEVILYADNTPLEIPQELLLCLADEPAAHQAFLVCSEAEQKAAIDWIYSAKKEATKTERMAVVINKLAKGQKPVKNSNDGGR